MEKNINKELLGLSEAVGKSINNHLERYKDERMHGIVTSSPRLSIYQHTYIHMSIIRCILQGSQKHYFKGQNLETLMTTNVWKRKYVYVSTIKWDRHLIHITAWMNLKGILNHESKYQEITIISSVWNTKTSNKLHNFHKHRSQVWQQINVFSQ